MSSAVNKPISASSRKRPASARHLVEDLRRRMTPTATRVFVLAERPDLGASAVVLASNIGYPAELLESGGALDLDRGLLLIVGDGFSASFMRQILTGIWAERTERVAIFGEQIVGEALAVFDRAGFPFVVSAAPTPDRLASIFATMAPESVDGRRAMATRRDTAAAAIEAGSDRLFHHIRSGDLSAAVTEARFAFDHFDALLDSAAAAHWLSIIQAYHNGTAQHCSLVSAIAMLFARRLGFSSGDQRRLFEAAHFHDVGKVEIPLSILDKPGALTQQEREVMETHASAGYVILAGNSALTTEVAEAARDHHEYLDGSGYPHGIGARAISDVTRLITISDIFAALIERRAYKKPRTAREAYAIMLSMEGRLDATLLKAFAGIAENCSSD